MVTQHKINAGQGFRLILAVDPVIDLDLLLRVEVVKGDGSGACEFLCFCQGGW